MKRIDNPSLDWDVKGNPVSTGFDDVYYNRKSGVEETRLVFLGGNNLPENWVGKQQFTIAETGFGTGLNFLTTWLMFDETALPGQRLDFISVEKYPLHKNDLMKALQPWREILGDARIDRLIEIYPPRIPGFHRRWVTDNITLTIIFDDVTRAYQQLEASVDAWFLDGFTPKKNADMWTPELYAEMARLSHKETTMASFTAAGDVKRSLKSIGFTIKRLKGYAYKYHRIIGTFDGGIEKTPVTVPDTINIIGAGIAGAGIVHALKRRGIFCTVFEKNDALGMAASGNKLGLINPKIEAQDNPRNDAGLAAFSFANHILADIPNIDYVQNGALHVGANEMKQDRLRKIFDTAGWLEPHLQWRENILYYKDSASVSTKKLVEVLLRGTNIQFGKNIDALPDDGVTILASGFGLQKFLPELPLQPVRGQVDYARISGLTMDYPKMFGHYVAPISDALFSIGASFKQNETGTEIRAKETAENIAALRENVPDCGDIHVTESWAQIRTASRDRFAMVGEIPEKNIYVSGALGSHGIQFGLLHGEIIACMLTGAPMPIGRDALNALSVRRFYTV